MAGRGTRTPANTGRRADINIGAIAGAFKGGAALKGGPETIPMSGPTQDGGVVPPMVTNTPYTVAHPVLDALSGGQDRAYANQLNSQMQLGNAERTQDLSSKLAIQQNQQLFELKLEQIRNSNLLSRDQKQAETAKAAADHQQALGVLTGANILATPESEEAYASGVNPTMIQAAADKGAEASTASRVGATKNFATLDALQGNYPDLVATAGNQIKTGRIKAEGDLATQPLVNHAEKVKAELQPTIFGYEASKAKYLPTISGLFDLDSNKLSMPSPAQQKQNSAMQIMQMLGNGGGGGANTPPTTVEGLTPPVVTPIGTQGDGSWTDPATGTIYYPDGRVVRKQVVTP